MLVAAARDNRDWAPTTNGDENPIGKFLRVGDWAVFAFKEERPATFDVFTMLIAETSIFNVKEFELLQGNELPTGSFQSIGKFKTQNAKLFYKPYQEFKFFPVTAKYLKVIVLSSHDDTGYTQGNAYAPRMQLFGVLQ